MVQKIEKRFIFGFLIAFASISSVCSQCCDFHDNPCTWDEGGWTMSSVTPPSLNQYPNFASSEPDAYFLYVQDQSDSAQSSSFSIASDGSVISFDYFLDSVLAEQENYLSVNFYNDDGSYNTWLTTIYTHSDIWLHAQVTCSSANHYCCGSIEKIPCSGSLVIATFIDTLVDTQALAAIDNVGTTCSGSSTGVPPSTTPTGSTNSVSTGPTTAPTPTPSPGPTQDGCCTFFQTNCGSSGTWYWSRDYPTLYIPNDFFEWSSVSGAVWESPVQTNVTSGTLFTLDFFIYSPYAQLSLGFKDMSSGFTYMMGLLTYESRDWHSYNFTCASCCGTSSICEGKLTITANIPDDSQVAIDNVGQNSMCYGSLDCCYFDDPSICGSVSECEDGYQWLYSGDVYPSYPVPSPGSDFVYFEAINNPASLKVGLKTELMTLNDGDYFVINYYSHDSYSEYNGNSLLITFNDVETNQTLILLNGIETGSEWQTWYFYEDEICLNFMLCTGYLEFVAEVALIGSEVAYGMDSITIGNRNCDMPSSESKNSTRVQFQSNQMNVKLPLA